MLKIGKIQDVIKVAKEGVLTVLIAKTKVDFDRAKKISKVGTPIT